MRKKLSQIRTMILVAVLELEKLEAATMQIAANKQIKTRPPHVELKLIKGGKG